MKKKQFCASNKFEPVQGKTLSPMFRGYKVSFAGDRVAVLFDKPVNINQMKVTWAQTDNDHGMYANAFNANGTSILSMVNQSIRSPYTFSGLNNCVCFILMTYGGAWAGYFTSCTFEMVDVQYAE